MELSTRDEPEDAGTLEESGIPELAVAFVRLDCASAGGTTSIDDVMIAAVAAAAARDEAWCDTRNII